MMNLLFLTIQDDPQVIRQTLNEILSQRQFAQLKESARIEFVEKILEYLHNSEIVKAFFSFLSWIIEGLAHFFMYSGMALKIVLALVFIAAVITAVILIRRKIVSHIKKDEGEESSDITNPYIHENLGKKAAEKGDYLTAIRHFYLAVLMLLNLKGILEYNLSRTNRETQKALMNGGAFEFIDSFKIINRMFENKIYALTSCSSAEFNEFIEAYESCRKGIEDI